MQLTNFKNSEVMLILYTYMSDAKRRLNSVLDGDSVIEHKHLGQIADSMKEWEGRIAEELGLIPPDVENIKHKYPLNLNLQKYYALVSWFIN